IHNRARHHTHLIASKPVAQQDSLSSLMTYIQRQHLTVITHHCTGFQCFHYPIGDQSLRELALRILEAENRPAPTRVQQELQLALIFFRRLGPESSTAKPAIDPQPCPDQARATPALL